MNTLPDLRKKAGLTQAQLAEKLGLTQAAIGHYETCRRKPSLEEARKIVSKLNELGVDCTLDEAFPSEQPEQSVA